MSDIAKENITRLIIKSGLTRGELAGHIGNEIEIFNKRWSDKKDKFLGDNGTVPADSTIREYIAEGRIRQRHKQNFDEKNKIFWEAILQFFDKNDVYTIEDITTAPILTEQVIGKADTKVFDNYKDLYEQLERVLNADVEYTVSQTFIGNFPLAPSDDLLKKYGNRHKFIRYFRLHHPIDINLCQSSIDLEDELNVTNYVTHDAIVSERTSLSSVNVTTLDGSDGASFGYTSYNFVPDIGVHKNLTQKADNFFSKAIWVSGDVSTSVLKSWLEQAVNKSNSSYSQENMNAAKIFLSGGSNESSSSSNANQKMRREYHLAVAVALVKSLTSNKRKSNFPLSFAAIVGGLARRRQARIGGDIDLLLVFDEITSELVSSLEKISRKIAARFRIMGKEEFVLDTISKPTKGHAEQDGQTNFHVLIHDKNSLRNWNKMVVRDWSEHHINLLKSDISECFEDSNFDIHYLLKERYGVEDCIKILKSGEIDGKLWALNESDAESYLKDKTVELSDREKIDFCTYAVRWCLKNYAKCKMHFDKNQIANFDQIREEVLAELGVSHLLKEECLLILKASNDFTMSYGRKVSAEDADFLVEKTVSVLSRLGTLMKAKS